MIPLAAVWRWLAGLPRIALVIALAVLLIAGGLWFTYHAGQRAGEVTVHRHALQDSVTTAHADVERTTGETERGRRLAKTVVQWSDSSRLNRKALRDSVESLLADLPEPVVTLIRRDDDVIRRDSVAITALVKVDAEWMAERAARIAADTVEAHQVAIGTPRRSHRALAFVAGTVIGVAGVLLLHAAVR